jgi:tetracycline resistance efflux pump
MHNTWLVLLPPLVAVLLASVTRRIQFSLFVGIIAASSIINDFNLHATIKHVGLRLWGVAEFSKLAHWDTFWSCANFFICTFLILIGILITMIKYSGAAYAYGAFIAGKLKTAAGVERATLLLATTFFIDDYFSSLTVGSVMQPIADHFKVARVKLALLVNSLPPCLALLVPLSSWTAELVGQLRNAGVGLTFKSTPIIQADPLAFYISTIPFMLYAFVIIASAWYMVLRRISYGILAKHEEYAHKTGELFGGKMPVARRVSDISAEKKKNSSLLDFFLPLGALFFSIIGWTLLTGGWWVLGGTNTFFQALQNSSIFAAFFVGGVATCLFTGLFLLVRGKLKLRELGGVIHEGASMMSSALIMLLFIWTLSTMLSKDLQCGEYVANLLIGRIDARFFPLMFFALAGLISTLIGTAWGTIGILLPLGIGMVPTFLGFELPVLLGQVPLLSVVVGAILSGSLIGMHMSPMADVMLMSATSVGAYHLDLVRAQISLTIPSILSSAIGYLVIGLALENYGYGMSAVFGLVSALITNIILLQFLHAMEAFRKSK